jgi:peptidoglycan/LPS O-acetylase OafA/YrhL
VQSRVVTLVADARGRAGRDDTDGMTAPTESPGPRIRPWAAFLVDLVVVAVFVLIGRRTHHEDAGFIGFLRVVWPFVVALVAGWALTRLDRAPLDWRRVAGLWVVTVALGMVLRITVEGHDFKVAFTIVATVFLGVCFFGWRLLFVLVTRRRSRASAG